jgi:APA family basic amino acid/polyamine antiporter
VTVIFLYIGISMVGLSLVSPQELGTRYIDDPVGGIAMNFPIGGQMLGPWVGLIAAVILLICANAGLIGCSRLMFSMGQHYQVPHVLFRLHHRFRTPHVALGVFSVLGIIVVIASRNQMLFLADLYNFGAQIAFCAAHVALIVLRFKRADLHRPFRAPFNIPMGKGRAIPLTAVIGALATFAVWCLVVITKPEGRVAGLGWMVLGVAMYFLYRRRHALPVTGTLDIEEVKIPEHKQVAIEHVLVAVHKAPDTEVLQTACEIAKHHRAKISAVYILEIPESMPMDADLKERELAGETILKHAEAISREYHLHMDLELVRARSIERALLDLVKNARHDVIVLGASRVEYRARKRFVSQAEGFLKSAPCRVIFCKS